MVTFLAGPRINISSFTFHRQFYRDRVRKEAGSSAGRGVIGERMRHAGRSRLARARAELAARKGRDVSPDARRNGRADRTVAAQIAAPEATISIDEFNSLSNAHRTELATLSEEFDGLLARMQTPTARAGMSAAFHATPKGIRRVCD